MNWDNWHLTPEHEKTLHRISYLNDKYEVIGRDGSEVIVRFGILGTAPTWLRVYMQEAELPNDHPPIPDSDNRPRGEATLGVPEDSVSPSLGGHESGPHPDSR